MAASPFRFYNPAVRQLEHDFNLFKKIEITVTNLIVPCRVKPVPESL